MSTRRDTDGERLWSVVAATVRPLPGRIAQSPPCPDPPERAASPKRSATAAPSVHPKPLSAPLRHKTSAPAEIEPGRRRRLVLDREPLMRRIDLHGLNQDGARSALSEFILRSAAEGVRAILVITGKGALGDGVLRRRVPDWLAEPPLRDLVAGLSEAHRRHGGAGALYVALKRRRPR